MISKFEAYLQSIGFKPFRYRKGELIPCNNLGFYSTMSGTDGTCFIDTRWVRDDVTIVYGLHEVGLHPTLIYPRVRLRKDNTWIELLSKYSPERIYKFIMR